jgi:hypothetical protein
VTLYESVVNGMPGYHSLGNQLNGLGALPARPAGVLHWPSVANAAMAAILGDLFAGASAPTLANITNLETTLADQYDDTVSAATITRSITYGQDIANAVFTWSQSDGFATWNNCSYTVPTGPGLWIPTPPAFVANPLQPCWGNLRPFALLYAAECSPLPPPPYSQSTGSVFYQQANEVYTTVNAADPAQIATAQYWADGGGSFTPPGHWISITCQLCTQQNLTLDRAARSLREGRHRRRGRVHLVLGAEVPVQPAAPISYIRDPTGPINDGAWVTVAGVGTPPFPEFPSGHSTQSGAAATVLQDLFGAIQFTDDSYAGTFPARTYADFMTAANEAAMSRLYAGIHYRAACERGVEQGQCIGAVILDSVQFHD